MSEIFKYDSIVTSVVDKMQSRARFGKQKYGTDLDRKDLNIEDWIIHIQEELMDAILYLEKLKKENSKDVWKEEIDDNGTKYYWNTVTRESRWSRP